MNRPAPDVLEAARLPALCRGVCLYAGLSLPPATSWNRFVVRSGAEPPELLARLMAEGLSADGIEVQVGTVGDPADRLTASLGRVVVCPGQAQHPPDVAELRSAAAVAGGPVLLF